MKKNQKIILFLFLLILLTSCYSKNMSEIVINQSLDDFIIGKWRATRQNSDIYGKYQENYFIKFINLKKLQYCYKSPINQFCEKFSYYKIDDGKIFVNNSRFKGGIWSIMRKEDKLQICIWSNLDCIEFTRDAARYDISLELFYFFK